MERERNGFISVDNLNQKTNLILTPRKKNDRHEEHPFNELSRVQKRQDGELDEFFPFTFILSSIVCLFSTNMHVDYLRFRL